VQAHRAEAAPSAARHLRHRHARGMTLASPQAAAATAARSGDARRHLTLHARVAPDDLPPATAQRLFRSQS
jgi:hypothetical protein